MLACQLFGAPWDEIATWGVYAVAWLVLVAAVIAGPPEDMRPCADNPSEEA